MTPDEVKDQLAEQVKPRACADRYIDRQEEREVLRIALQQGLTAECARAALAEVCAANDYVLESQALARVEALVDADGDGLVDEKGFHDAVSACKEAARGKKTDAQVKRLVLELIEDGGYKVKTGLLTNWYKRAKHEAGMA